MFNKIVKFKVLKRVKQSILRSRYKTNCKKVIGHFIFNLTKSQLEKKLFSKFKRMLLNLKLKPREIIVSLISNEMIKFRIHREESLDWLTIISTKNQCIRTGVSL